MPRASPRSTEAEGGLPALRGPLGPKALDRLTGSLKSVRAALDDLLRAAPAGKARKAPGTHARRIQRPITSAGRPSVLPMPCRSD